jgi:hypothetical protein
MGKGWVYAAMNDEDPNYLNDSTEEQWEQDSSDDELGEELEH